MPRLLAARTIANANELIAAITPTPPAEPRRRSRFAVPLTIALSAIAVVLALRVGGPSETTTWRGRPVVEPPQDEPPTYQPRYANSFALVIGCNYQGNEHGHTVLKNAENDAKAFHERLEKLGFQSELLVRATAAQFTTALRAQSRRWSRDDRVVLYFAGHGTLDPRDNKSFKLLPADAGNKETLDGWIDLASEMKPCLTDSGAKHILVVLDCCHAGSIMRGTAPLFGVTPDGDQAAPYRARDAIQRPARWILASTMKDELSADGAENEGHSPFTAALLTQLDRANAGELVSMLDLYSTARQALEEKKVRQRPLLARLRRDSQVEQPQLSEFWFWPPNDSEDAKPK